MKKGEETKRLIIENSYKIFAQKGYKDVTMKDICEACKLSRGGLYRHYQSTYDIFQDVLMLTQKEDIDEFEEMMKNKISAVNILENFIDDFILQIQCKGASINNAIYEFCIVHKNEIGKRIFEKQFRRGIEVWTKLIQYGISLGKFKEVDAKAVAQMILFSTEGLKLSGEVLEISSEIAKNYKKQILNLLLKEI
ncbi:TetR/AcrR family transcriptional regulator [Clostridium sp. JN-1]|jgi:AcrR family transcriptional regulator|uniref:TetR/AcrR family transcriptional regulator n=1 Tax=Clostridium sp. JN-1 TaxID=2483110 RepID=UPI000F0B9B50|nr:TetR/AcrR family transcriptional regulator [Clostridium sp. JN-1]